MRIFLLRIKGMAFRLLVVSLLLMALLPCLPLSARNYVGGSFSVSTGLNVNVAGETVNSTAVSLSPEFGWLCGERWAVGFKPLVGFNSMSPNHNRAFNLGISPYARYRFLELKKFGLWAEGDVDFIYSRSKNDSSAGSSSLTYGLAIRPLLTYDLTEHISLYGSVNLFSLSLYGNSSISEGVRFNSLSFGLSGRSDDVVDSLSKISIGFIYLF